MVAVDFREEHIAVKVGATRFLRQYTSQYYIFSLTQPLVVIPVSAG
jgi:hypothetical protein